MLSQDAIKLSPAQRVTSSITAMLQRGVRPWKRPWDDAGLDGGLLPRRANGTPYRGMNVVALWAAAADAGFASPYWFTFKQALSLGGQVRKGEHGAFVIFYKPVSEPVRAKPADDGEDERNGRAVLRGYVVFNRSQIDGLDDRFEMVAGKQVGDRFLAS